jgi:tetratricopeptide (TPR) repeat protein
MKMKRILYILPLVFLLLSCGVRSDKDIPPPINLPELLETAWNLYDAGDYQAAADTFDLILSYDNTIIDAYLGLGFSYGMLGQVTNAKPVFRLTVSVALGAMPDRVGVDQNVLPDTTLRVYLTYGPILSVQKVTDVLANEYDVKYFGVDEEGRSYIELYEEPDTLLKITYTYFDSTAISGDVEKALWAYCGEAGLYINEEEGEEANALNAALTAEHLFHFIGDTTLVFEHYPRTDLKKIKLLAAIAAFRLELYKNVVEIILSIDPTWTPPDDPFDPSQWAYILEKLEELQGS